MQLRKIQRESRTTFNVVLNGFVFYQVDIYAVQNADCAWENVPGPNQFLNLTLRCIIRFLMRPRSSVCLRCMSAKANAICTTGLPLKPACILLLTRACKSPLFPPSFELGTFRVLGERDNHYTMETVKEARSPCASSPLPLSRSYS